MNASQFDCMWCGKGPHEHGQPGLSEMGGKLDRLCPCDSYGRAVTSQFYSPKIQIKLIGIRNDLREIKKAVDDALEVINEVLDT